MVALPGQLFYRAQSPFCICLLAKNKTADAKRGFRDRCNESRFVQIESDIRMSQKIICLN